MFDAALVRIAGYSEDKGNLKAKGHVGKKGSAQEHQAVVKKRSHCQLAKVYEKGKEEIGFLLQWISNIIVRLEHVYCS